LTKSDIQGIPVSVVGEAVKGFRYVVACRNKYWSTCVNEFSRQQDLRSVLAKTRYCSRLLEVLLMTKKSSIRNAVKGSFRTNMFADDCEPVTFVGRITGANGFPQVAPGRAQPTSLWLFLHYFKDSSRSPCFYARLRSLC
ncbi:uncharacterized protein CLUP02_02557, partial [Colletotrichum lupini]